ncbi:hypothetical protein LguiA_013979 [Lonicera macranthoides]
MEKEEEFVMRGKVEIDMQRPFSSVKEVVMLFGESVLAKEFYGNKLKDVLPITQRKYLFLSTGSLFTAKAQARRILLALKWKSEPNFNNYGESGMVVGDGGGVKGSIVVEVVVE